MKQLAFIIILRILSLSYIKLRDDTHMTSMKIVPFSRPPPPLSSYVQNSFTPLTLDAQFQTNLSPHPHSLTPNDNQSIKRKHNPRMTIICYQVFPSGRLSFSVSTHCLVFHWLSPEQF